MQRQECPRGLDNCQVLNNLVSDDGVSFVCAGYNRKEDRQVHNDRFTVCFKNEAIDDLTHWDKRDIIDTVSVLMQAVSIDENIRVAEDLSEDQMNDLE